MDLRKTLVGVVVTGLGASATLIAEPTLGVVVSTVGLVILIDGALDSK